jgi:hypothetical protein
LFGLFPVERSNSKKIYSNVYLALQNLPKGVGRSIFYPI